MEKDEEKAETVVETAAETTVEKAEETTAETTVEPEEKTVKTKKKRPLALRLLLLPVKLLLVFLLIVLVWFTFCFFDRIKPADALPPDYALYMRTDSVWDTTEPLLDLDATLVAMTSPELQKYRDKYLLVKSSKLRKNFFVRQALKRRVDAALYASEKEGEPAAIIVLDAGFLSGALRLSPVILPRIKALSKQMDLAVNRHGSFYLLQNKEAENQAEAQGTAGENSEKTGSSADNGCFVIKKNLIIFSTSRSLLEEAMTYSNSALYKKAELEAVNARMKDPLRIFVNGEKLIELAGENQLAKQYLQPVVPYLSEDEYTNLNFGITNNELNVTISVPMNNKDPEHPVIKLTKKDSSVPGLLPKFSEDVQYYTLISSGTLKELFDAALKIVPSEKNLMSTWNKSDQICRIVFNLSLDDLFFSWSADEFAVFGIEGKSEPVFAIKIADEERRRVIFDRVFSSYIIQSNDSLLVDGVRLPCIQMPGFVLSILQALNINVPKPYYLIKDGYLYLTQSPENLVAINFDYQNSKKLSGSENWMRVSSRQNPYSSLSLYYNLERSIPFFIKGNSAMSKVLELYNSGRFDLRIKDNTLTVQLQASAVAPESSRHIPGFPVELEKKSNAELVKSNAKKSKMIYWVETDNSVNSLDCGNFERGRFELEEVRYIVAASEATVKANGGELWAVTKSGMVYLLNAKLESVFGYPILTGLTMSCPPFAYKDSLVLVDNEGSFCLISNTGELSGLETGVESDIKASPKVSGDIMAFYEKGFFGGIHLYKDLKPLNEDGPFELDGIAYGSPCIFTQGGKQYVAMITQAGELYVYDFDGNLLEPFPIALDGIFYLNVEMADGYLFALSSEGELYRVSLDGQLLKVRIPYFTAKTGRITVCDYDDKEGQEIFVSGEGNSLYGFNSSLELLPEFPVSGYGNPLFIDLNGDNRKDCLSITFDNKISAAKVR